MSGVRWVLFLVFVCIVVAGQKVPRSTNAVVQNTQVHEGPSWDEDENAGPQPLGGDDDEAEHEAPEDRHALKVPSIDPSLGTAQAGTAQAPPAPPPQADGQPSGGASAPPFDQADSNHDGQLDRDEYEAAVRGGKRRPPTERSAPPNAKESPQLGAWLLQFLTVFPPIASQLVFLAPVPAMWEFRKAGSTGDVSPIPYLSMTFNGILYCVYGWLCADKTIVAANVPAAFLGTFYTTVFLRYKPHSLSMAPHMGAVVVMLLLIFFIVGVCESQSAKAYIGILGCSIGVMMFAGPLSAIRVILRDRSTRSLPFAFTVASFTCCVAWAGYGYLVIRDAYIYVPNFLGLVASTLQLSLFAIFNRHGKDASRTFSIADVTVGWDDASGKMV